MIKRFWDWVDGRAVVRRLVLAVTVWATIDVTVFVAWDFAAHSPYDGVGTAAVIAAITAPLAALQGFAFASYTKGRSE